MTQSTKARERRPTLIQLARDAVAKPEVCTTATAAFELFRSYCAQPMPRIPGCDTWLRLAIRADRGWTVRQVAAREYHYRWWLFLDAWTNHTESRSRSRHIHARMCYPAPHLLGM